MSGGSGGAAWRWTVAGRPAVHGGGGATVPPVALAGPPGEPALALDSGAAALAAPDVGYLPGSVEDKMASRRGAGEEDRILEGSVE